MKMDNKIFKKDSVEKISSPESLDDYIKVASPGVWMILAAVLILLVGVVVWGIFGDIKLYDKDGNLQEVKPISIIIN